MTNFFFWSENKNWYQVKMRLYTITSDSFLQEALNQGTRDQRDTFRWTHDDDTLLHPELSRERGVRR